MKKALVLAIILMVALGAVYGAPKIKIGVSIANFDDTFLMYMKDGMDRFAKTLPDVSITYVDAREDTAKQLSQVENFLAQKMDAIVVVPVNTEATGPITKAVTGAKKPLVYVNRLPSNLPKGVVFVGSQSIDAGLFQMDYLGKKMNGKGNIVILIGKLDNEAAIKRTEGVKQIIAQKYPGIKVIKEQVGDWSREKGRTIMENWLATGDQIDAVASNNDDMALGALLAIQAAGKLHKIIVAGVDATPDAIAEMAKGNLDVTVFQNADGQGGGSIQAAYKLAKGQTVEERVWIPYELVTPDNYKKYSK